MSRKARQQLLRERDRQARLREEELLVKNAERIKRMEGGFSRTPITAESRAAFRRSATLGTFNRAADACATPEPVRPAPKVVIPKPVPKYEGEMAVREKRAQEQYELMKLRTAPVGNKMGYQYIPPGSLDEADITSGKTRRRS